MTLTTEPNTRTTPSVLRVGWSRVVLELKVFFRERDSVVFSFLLPIVLLAIFAVAFGNQDITVDQTTISLASYFAPGLVAAGIFLVSFQTLAIGIAVEREERTLKRLRGTPMPQTSYFIGKVGMVLVAAAAQTVLLLLVAALVFGVELPTEPDKWLTFAWVFLLGTAGGTTLGIAYSSAPKSAKSASAVVTGPALILMFISGIFFVFRELPEWLQQIASVFPLRWLGQGMRSALLPDELVAVEVSDTWQHGTTALVLAGWMVAGLLLATWTFRWIRRDDS